jgi:hypothetical protein
VGVPPKATPLRCPPPATPPFLGGYGDNSSTGAVWVFTRSNGVWTQQGNKLVGTGAVGNAQQGISVALSADGNTAAVGGNADNKATGATWVFTRSNGVWTQQGGKLVGTEAAGAAQQGWSVALSADGSTAMVGGFGDNSNIGAAWVFNRINGVWTQQGSKLVADSGECGQRFRSIADSVPVIAAPVDGFKGSLGVVSVKLSTLARVFRWFA